MSKTIMPIQPIEQDEHGTLRFIPNGIVRMLLDADIFDMNKIALMNFTDQERIQFAQLIGYSVSGFGELSYVDNETYGAVDKMTKGETEVEARNSELREQLDNVREGVKITACAVFNLHPDDLDSTI